MGQGLGYTIQPTKCPVGNRQQVIEFGRGSRQYAGGITRGDEVARGIVEARANLEREVPMVVRIVGTNAEEAKPILAEANLITADSLDDAAAKAVAAAQGARA